MKLPFTCNRFTVNISTSLRLLQPIPKYRYVITSKTSSFAHYTTAAVTRTRTTTRTTLQSLHHRTITTTPNRLLAMASATQLGFYDFKPLDKKGEPYDLAQLKGKVVLVVNVASKCGLTPQYEGLEALYAKYKEQGLEVLGFPCNGFAGQAPGTSEEQASFCTLTYGVKFPVLGKVEVNGSNADPMFEFLKSQKPGIMGLKRIKWNFEKFLVSRDGTVVERWAPTTKPESLAPTIEKELAKSAPAAASA